LENNAGSRVLSNLQGLRGIAALMVCFYHLSAVLPEGLLRSFLKQGIIGVQLFFMISGYIMVHTTRGIPGGSIAEAGKYLLKRFIRIAPLYYIATFLYIADDINNGYLQDNLIKVVKTLLFIPQMTNIHGPYYGVPVLEVGWSLNYEMLFYLLLAAGLFFNQFKYFSVITMLSLIVFIAPLTVGSSFTFDYSIYHHFTISYLNFASNPIMIHFIFGMLMALIIPKITWSKVMARASFPLSILLFGVYYSGMLNLEINALNDLIFCGAMFTAFLINDFHREGYKIGRLIIKIGDSSYSLYLFHIILFVYLKMGFQMLGMGNSINSYGFFMFASLFCVAGSYAIWQFGEKKLHRKLNQILFNKINKSG